MEQGNGPTYQAELPKKLPIDRNQCFPWHSVKKNWSSDLCQLYQMCQAEWAANAVNEICSEDNQSAWRLLGLLEIIYITFRKGNVLLNWYPFDLIACTSFVCSNEEASVKQTEGLVGINQLSAFCIFLREYKHVHSSVCHRKYIHIQYLV